MTPATQAKLLRVLQERTFRRAGRPREQSVDVRVIAATNATRSRRCARAGSARTCSTASTSSRSACRRCATRKDDIPLLAQAFFMEFSERNGRSIAGVSEDAMRLLERHHWPGNVRELRNVMERATIVAQGPFIEAADLPPLPPTAAPCGCGRRAAAGLAPGTTVDQAERQLIEVTLQHTGGNKTRAAELLGISLKTLHNKLNRMKDERQE